MDTVTWKFQASVSIHYPKFSASLTCSSLFFSYGMSARWLPENAHYFESP